MTPPRVVTDRRAGKPAAIGGRGGTQQGPIGSRLAATDAAPASPALFFFRPADEACGSTPPPSRAPTVSPPAIGLRPTLDRGASALPRDRIAGRRWPAPAISPAGTPVTPGLGVGEGHIWLQIPVTRPRTP